MHFYLYLRKVGIKVQLWVIMAGDYNADMYECSHEHTAISAVVALTDAWLGSGYTYELNVI